MTEMSSFPIFFSIMTKMLSLPDKYPAVSTVDQPAYDSGIQGLGFRVGKENWLISTVPSFLKKTISVLDIGFKDRQTR